MEQVDADVLVAGGGVTGLMAAFQAQSAGARVVLLQGTAGQSQRISSLSAALSRRDWDDPEVFSRDIIAAGGFLNQPDLVTAMIERVTTEVRRLEKLGVPFCLEGGELARRRASGSSQPWAIFTEGMVGREISRILVQQLRGHGTPAVKLIQGARLLDLRLSDGAICGGVAYLPRESRWLQIDTPAVVLATGGAGRLFGATTNPPGSRGTGLALAMEAGVPLIDMEFTSFEPFIVAAPARLRGRDLPTTVLTEGARLRNGRGEEFIDTANAPSKDVICRAMVREVREGRGTPSDAISYDLREMTPEAIGRYAQIVQVLKALGRQPADAQIEVMPSEHCVVGGIRIDHRTATTIAGLYAAGEVSGGVHGAHRLATCGGTEALAFGAIAGEHAANYALTHHPPSPPWAAKPPLELADDRLGERDRHQASRIARALDEGCGILREGEALRRAASELNAIRDDLAAEGRLKTPIGRTTLLALCMVLPAFSRTESRGDHYRTDYPRRDDARWLGSLVSRYDASRSQIQLSFEPSQITPRAIGSAPAD